VARDRAARRRRRAVGPLRSDLARRERAAPIARRSRVRDARLARVDRIPTLAEPARLPPGAGTAVLNLVAELARARASGGSPTAALPDGAALTTLLESFRYVAPRRPARAFLRARGVGAAPHERSFPRGLYVQLRGRVEKVVFRGAAYYRPTGRAWRATRQARAGHARRRGVLALGVGAPARGPPALSRDGELLRVLEPSPRRPPPPRAMFPEIQRGIAATVAAVSAPPSRRSSARPPRTRPRVGRALARAGRRRARRIRVSTRLRSVLVELMGAARGRGERRRSPRAVVEVAALAATRSARAPRRPSARSRPKRRPRARGGRSGSAGDARGAQEIAGAVERCSTSCRYESQDVR